MSGREYWPGWLGLAADAAAWFAIILGFPIVVVAFFFHLLLVPLLWVSVTTKRARTLVRCVFGSIGLGVLLSLPFVPYFGL